MLFNSYIFIFLFLPLALTGWFLLNRFEKYKIAQWFLIAMSLWFYAFFNVSHLAVILGSCMFNYGLSFALEKIHKPKAFLWTGVIGNLALLGYFKYYDFFLENINALFRTDFNLRHVLLPLGISFFTFQQLAFIIDRCKGKAPHYALVDYLSYITFFPKLSMGPIAFHGEMIPQFQDKSKRRFNGESFADGLIYFTIGLGKKVLLADTLAKAVNFGFDSISGLDSISALLVAVAYTLELYFDFSGYCDMAIGIGKMFHIEIPDNFISPYHSASVKEFWRRWHITLGRFFTTYVYIPLGGNRGGKWKTFRNTMIVFLLSGLWHGANWTFVFWGFLHGLGVSFTNFFGRKEHGKWKHKLYQMITFIYVCFAFVFFRSDSMAHGIEFFKRIFSFTHFGSLYVVAEKMVVPELYMVTKLLSMKAPQYLATVNLITFLTVLGISLFIITRKNTGTIVKNCNYSLGFALKMSVIFVWSVLSLSGVSTFLYFNF